MEFNLYNTKSSKYCRNVFTTFICAVLVIHHCKNCKFKKKHQIELWQIFYQGNFGTNTFQTIR